MSVVNLLGINVMNNPAKFGDPYTFEITFECLEPLQKGTRITFSLYNAKSHENFIGFAGVAYLIPY